MKVWPLASFLADFSAAEEPPATAGGGVSADAGAPPSCSVADPTLLAEARREGREEALAEARAAADAAEAAWRQETEDRLLAEREACLGAQADAMTSTLSEAVRSLETRLTEQVAAVLGQIVECEARRRSLDAFAEVLREMLGQPGAIKVTGPAGLIEALRARLPAEVTGLSMEASSEGELRATRGEGFVETRLAAWAEFVRDPAT